MQINTTHSSNMLKVDHAIRKRDLYPHRKRNLPQSLKLYPSVRYLAVGAKTIKLASIISEIQATGYQVSNFKMIHS